ncbi:Amidohydrolase family protein [Trichomonas vaginalis G3]|uniref:Amidohydrolase family protein n=1 Tax=Trichomonas vaginalis (strain ATCC PRA-98 / G3) TaxID=412133 RepID=A2DIY8_TRIV3|nr:putative selenium metabolism protein SSNA family [Trichomonas vaginalis G3]EAY19563.1 Amidohydrolase family protein [Trichomonas vaginalis G3]KAI5515892.1 putative selenium metabolism protein SSNA family [Trichomonas vaginalis G3]|eukprot:XP_001580549.1 Amidohydrolase family protein [Trichomonas vaginalis G3]
MLSSCATRRLKTIVGNGKLIRSLNHDLEENGAVVYEDDTIIDIGKTEVMRKKYAGSKYINADGKLIMPGLINAHGHYYSFFSRGMSLKDPLPYTFLEVLERLWWRLDRALQHEDNYLSAAADNIAAIKAGTTTIIDHHASPNAIEGALDDIAQAALDAGVRNHIAYEVTDRNGMDGAYAGIEENRRFIERCYKKDKNPMLAASFGLHAAFTCSDETLKKSVEALASVKEAAGKVGFHIHVAEGKYDEEQSLKNHGKTVVDRLVEFGIAGPETIYGHCVHVNDHELDLIKKTGTNIVTNPASNMNNAVGLPRAIDFVKRGIPLALGTDGCTYDMFQEMKFLYFGNKFINKDPRVFGWESGDVLFNGNSKIASKAFQKKVGVLEKGAFADIILVDYQVPTVLSTGSLPWHMVFGMTGANVHTTIVGGRTVMRNRELLKIDEKEVMARARERTPGVWERL